MRPGTKVSFRWLVKPSLEARGTGVIISLPDDAHALVAVDPEMEGAPHVVIYCTLTWLTVIP